MDAWDCMRGRFCRLSRRYCLLHESFFANLFRWVSDDIIPFHPLFGLIERQQTYSSSAVRLPAFYKQVHLTSSLSVLNLPALQAVRIWWSNVRVGVPKLGYGLRALVLEPLRSSYVGRSANKLFWCEVKAKEQVEKHQQMTQQCGSHCEMSHLSIFLDGFIYLESGFLSI